MDWFLLGFISALFSTAAAVSQKKILYSLDALSFSFVLSLFILIFSTPFFFFINYSDLSSISLTILFLKSILGTFAFLCVMITIKRLEISRGLPLMVLTPGLVAFFAFIFLGESLTSIEVTGMLLLLTGTYLLETKSKQGIFDPFKVILKSPDHRFIIVALILFTVTSILDKLLLSSYRLPPVAFIGFQHLFMAINFFLIVIFYRKNTEINFTGNKKNLLLGIAIVAILTIGYRYSQIEAIKIAPVALVLSIKRISVFFAAVIGGKLFKEENLIIKAIAAAIMVAGAIMIVED